MIVRIILVMDIGDVPIPLPNVKASILGPVRIHRIDFDPLRKLFRYRSSSFVIIIRMIPNPNPSMKMMTMIRTKISTNPNGRHTFPFLSKLISRLFSSDDISEWDQNFIKRFTVPEGTLFDIIMVNHFASTSEEEKE